MIAQDFVAADLLQECGEYDPQFDTVQHFIVEAGSQIDTTSLVEALIISYYGPEPRILKIIG